MVLSHEIYIDQLALSLGGCPLWGSLHPQEDPVDIGDVGYLSDNGGWIKLFNLRTETDPRDLPLNHQPGSLIITDKDINKDIFKGPRYSDSVESLGGNLGVQGKAEVGLSYECTEEKGAILFVAEDAVTRDALNKSLFVKLIRDNIHDWVNFAEQKGRNVKMDDLILVTGYVRTTTWVAAVFARRSQSCKFTMGGVIPVADTGAKLQLWGSIHNVNAFAWTGGPEKMKTGSPLDTTHFLKHMAPETSPPALLCKDDPRHQCVLVRGYRMADRNWRQLLSFKKKKQLKGIEVLKWNTRNSTRIPDNDDPTPVLPTNFDITNDAPIPGTTISSISDYTQSLEQPSISQHPVLNEGGSSEAVSSTSDQDTNLILDPSSRGRSSNRRGRRTRRGQRRGNDSDQGLNHGNGRRDGGAGAGAGSRSGGSLGAGQQLGSASGGAANSGGQPVGTRGGTSQQTSRNVDDDVELDDLFHQWGQSSRTRSTVQETSDIGLPSLEDIQSDCESDYSPSDGGDSVEVSLSPWEVFLEYLLRTEGKADYAIVHDDDFSVLPIQPKSVNELETQFQASNPRVYLNGSIGMLKPTALEFFRSTGYFYQTDTEGRIGYFSKSVLPNMFTPPVEAKELSEAEPLIHATNLNPSDNHIHTFSGYQENPDILFAPLKKIHIHAKTYIHSIQCEYQGPENKTFLGNKHGNSGDAPLYIFGLDSDECITKIRGRSGDYIDQLQFFTNRGRISPLYGGSSGNLFIWTLDEKRHPDNPGLHHFEGTFQKYIQTLRAAIPIYPWFEGNERSMIRKSENTGLDMFALGAMFTIREICDVVMVSHKHTADTVQYIRADTVFKLLRETESRSYIFLAFKKVLKMLKSQEISTIKCGLMIFAELARLGQNSFDFDIKNTIQIPFVRELLMDKKRFVLLQDLSERRAFIHQMMNLLSGLMGLLTDSDQSVRSNASVMIGYLSEQPNFHASIQGMIDENQLIDLLQHKEYLVRSTSITLLAKLSEQIRSQPCIIDAFPSIMNLFEDSVSHVRMTVANAIGNFVEQEGLRPVIREHITEIIQKLLDLLKNGTYIQLSGRNAIIKLSQQGNFRGAILKILPDLLNLFKREYLSVRASAITLLAYLADHGKPALQRTCIKMADKLAQAGMTTEILHMLRPDILTPSISYNPSIWVRVLAVSSALLNQLKTDGKLDYYVSQLLVGMLVDADKDIRDKSAEIVMKLLRYVEKPSVIHALIDLTRSSEISSCKLNGVNALLTVGPGKAYQNEIYTVIRNIIPDLVKMLCSDSDGERARVVTVLREIGERSEFRQNVGEIVLEIIRLFEPNPHPPAIRSGIEVLIAFLKHTEIQQDITDNYSNFKFLLAILSDSSVVLAGLSLAMGILSMNGTHPLRQLMALMIAPSHIRTALTLGDSDINHKGIMVLLCLLRSGQKDDVLTMVKELIFHIADSSQVDSIRDPFLPKLHIDGKDKLLMQLSEQDEFQSVILEPIPMFVMAAKYPGDKSAYNILKLLSVRRGLQSAIQLAVPPVVDRIESSSEYLEPCLDLLWTLSEQAAYRSAIMPFASRLASMMRGNTRPDVQVTMAGILMNLRTLPSDITT